MEQGFRLPPLHCCYLGPLISTGGCTAEPLPRWQVAPSSTLAPNLARPFPLTMNGVAGELLGLVPALRRAHSDLRGCGWLGIIQLICV